MRNSHACRLAVALSAAALALLLSASAAQAPSPNAATPPLAPALVAAPAPSAPETTSAPAPKVDAASTGGAAAIVHLGRDLPVVAERHGWSTEQLTQLLLEDATLRVDSTDQLFYVEPVSDVAAAADAVAAAADAPQGAAPYPLADTFKLHSVPGAKLTILLDFGGRTMTGNAWTANYNSGNPIVAPPYSLDADPAFSDAERTAIQDVWRRVAEDYAPFNVDVTTEFTAEAAITRSNSADLIYGTRVLISPMSSYVGAYGGIAYIGVFNTTGDYYKPALVFSDRLYSSKSIAEAASHECGHNLNLTHDGTPSQGYYPGSGSGETGWAPLMGSGYGQNLTQWSRGEYPDANNQQDDLSIISGYTPRKPDDAGDTAAAAVELPASATLSVSGLISSSTDVDVYRFVAGAGPAAITVAPVAVGPNLDILAEIRDSGGGVVASSNPVSSLSASLNRTMQPGTYYLFVRGTGKGSPLEAGGYSSYASIGQYTVSGAVVVGPGSVSGVVTAGGSPLPGVTVTVPGSGSVATGADGSYTMGGLAPGVYSVSFAKQGYVSQMQSITVVSGAATTTDVSLLAVVPGTLSGTVSSGGSPLAGVTVSVPGHSPATTAADGGYAVSGINPGTYSATYSKTGHASQTLSVTVVSSTVTVRNVSLVPLTGTLSGTVSSGGTPLAGVSVSVPGTATATTGDSGTYARGGLTPGTYGVTYSKSGYASQTLSVTISAGGTTTSDVSLATLPTKAPTTIPVHRFFNKKNSSHFYTASAAEKASVEKNFPAIYAYDGVAYRVSSTYTTPLHRFFNKKNGSHFYTASAAEKASVEKNFPAIYAYDGVAYSVSAVPGAESRPVYRFFNKKNGSHFYTASAAEKASVEKNFPAVYAYDGVAFYVLP